MGNKQNGIENSQNPKKGADFERRVSRALKVKFGVEFYKRAIKIGNPRKEHKFDLVSNNEKIVVECKKYSWTKTGNVPSAKMAFINEAVFYLLHLSNSKLRIVVLAKNTRMKNTETLAEYYFRINRHLLDGVKIFEFDEMYDSFRELSN